MQQFTNYLDLYRHVLKLFYLGQYKPGDRFPTQIEMADSYHVAANSIKKVFKLLLNDGFITTDRSFGTHVLFDRDNPAHMARVPVQRPNPDGYDSDTLITPARFIAYVTYHGLKLATPRQFTDYANLVTASLAQMEQQPSRALPPSSLYVFICQELGNQYLIGFSEFLRDEYLWLDERVLEDPTCFDRVREMSLDFYRQLHEMLQSGDYSRTISSISKYYQGLYRVPGLFAFAILDDERSPFTQQSLYTQLMHKLLLSIMAKNMQSGDLLPTESQMAREYGVSLITVRKASSVLKELGLIDGERFVGTHMVENWSSPAVQEKIGTLLDSQKKQITDAIFAEYIINHAVCDWVATRIPPEVADTMQQKLDAQWEAYEAYQAPLFISEAFLTPIVDWLNAPLLTRCYYYVHQDLTKFLAIRLLQKSAGFCQTAKVHTYAERALGALRQGHGKAFLSCLESAVVLNWELMRTAFDDTICRFLNNKPKR